MQANDLEEAFSHYDEVLEAKASTLKKVDKKTLIDLDNWYQHELPVAIQERKIKCITHAELCKLMKWKLMRGKFRPKLTEMVESNKPQSVLDASQSAFDLLPDVEQALKALTVLKAVGPATASAILAAGAPDQVPFMADESMLAALPGRPKAYTLPYFLDYLDAVKNLVKQLNKDSGVSKDNMWTPHKVELALWSKSMKSSLGISLGVQPAAPPEKKRRRVNVEGSTVQNGTKTRGKKSK